MTAHKHLKRLVRERMNKTGESYTSARRHVIRQATPHKKAPTHPWHFPGNVPGATVLRVLLAHAGVCDPRSGEPLSESMAFGIAGGIGIGVFQFFYEKEDFASFFLAGRHRWHDELAYLSAVAERFGVKPVVRESTGARTAEKHLAEALADGPCVAWVDAASLPHRAMPASYLGSGYHVVTVYRLDGDQALIGDLADEPIAIPIADLTTARGRIKKDRHRLLSLPPISGKVDWKSLLRAGLAVCAAELPRPSVKGMAGNFKLDALLTWAERLHGSKDKDRWERVFASGANFWRGLTSIYDYIEHYGSGGGLCRPIFAEFLAEAAEVLKDNRLTALSERYQELGQMWSELADAALPSQVPAFRKARKLLNRKAELIVSEGPTATDEVREIWSQLDELARAAGECFPLSEPPGAELRVELQQRVRAIHTAEVTALAELTKMAMG